jgi:hypothetical protein
MRPDTAFRAGFFRRLLSRIALLVALAVPGHVAAAELEWQTITVREDGFSVEMPGKPQHRINLQDPELFAGVSEHGADLAPGFVMVSVFMFRPEKRALLSDDEILNLGAAMIPRGCRETESGPIAGGPGAARAVDFTCPDDVTLAYRLHLYGDRLYRLAAGGPRGAAESDAADRFFRSFEIVE